MATMKKVSSNLRNLKTVRRQQSSNEEAVSSATSIRSLTTAAIQPSLPGTNNVNKNHPQTSSTIMRNSSDQLSGGISLGRSLRSSDKNVASTNVEVNGRDKSAMTDYLDISGFTALMTDDSETSSVIDLTESINEAEENNELSNGGDGKLHQKRTTTAPRNSIRKPLKRLACTTTPRYDISKDRKSKDTPYIRKASISSTNHRNCLSNEMKFSTGKKERVAEEAKKSLHVKRVTFNKSPSINRASASVAKLNQSKPQSGSIKKKKSAVKMPNFNVIHKNMFEKMESIDVTVRKREERMTAASSKKGIKGSSQGNVKDKDTSTKSKKVFRKLDNTQPDSSNISQAVSVEEMNELPKSERSKSKSSRAAPKVGVLQERSNCDSVFKFIATSDSKMVSQPFPSGKNTVENRAKSRQQAYKARPVPQTHPQNTTNRLKGVRLNRRFQLQMKSREENQNKL